MSALLPRQIYASAETSDWFRGTPQITDQFDIRGDALPYSINGNRDCTKQKIVTKPDKILPYWPYIQYGESHDSCVVYTGFGAVSQTGYLQTAGESTFGRVVYPWNGSMTLLPVPRTANALYIEANPGNGVSVHLIRDYLANIEGSTLANGEILYKVKAGTNITSLRGSNGQLLGVQLDSVSFSASGKWMIADIPYLGLTRIDTASLNYQVFDAGFDYTIGTAPGVQSAVTNTGRYVAVSSPGFTRFRLYNLEDCTGAGPCRYFDLYKQLQQSMPGFVSGVRLRFSYDYALRMYAVQKNGTVNKVIRQTVRAAGHEATSFGYLGLGDSFASGEGAYQYKTNTDTGFNKCHVSLRSYPYLIADELGLNEAESIACSGAMIEDLISDSRSYKGQVKDKVEVGDRTNITELLEQFSSGYLPQQEFVTHYQPDVITISTVGNDIGFSDKIKACLMPGTCYSTYEDRVEIANEVNNQFGRLTGMYADIKNEMPGKKVYVLGYPEIALDGGSCGSNVRLDGEEIKFANQLVRHLNKMIKAAAENVGVFYVDVEKAFYGHRLCETTYANTAVHGITGGDDIIDVPFTDFGGPIGNESFHPNALGHRKFKETILSKTSNFNAPMPNPNINSGPPKITDSIELLYNMPKTGRTIKAVQYLQGLTDNNVFYPAQTMHGGLAALKLGLKPFSAVEIWLHSEPAKLGDFTTDESGNIMFDSVIPADTEYGFHTIHIYGTNLFGRPVDIQKVIYVASPPKPAELKKDTDVSEPNVVPATESVNNVKPPENNPETVAGHEQINETPKPQESRQPDPINSSPQTAYITSPYFTATDSSPESTLQPNTKQVAGLSSKESIPDSTNEPALSSNINYWPYIALVACFIFLPTVLIFRRSQ